MSKSTSRTYLLIGTSLLFQMKQSMSFSVSTISHQYRRTGRKAHAVTLRHYQREHRHRHCFQHDVRRIHKEQCLFPKLERQFYSYSSFPSSVPLAAIATSRTTTTTSSSANKQTISSIATATTPLSSVKEENKQTISNVPLIFVPGMKGTHLSYYTQQEVSGEEDTKGVKMEQPEKNKIINKNDNDGFVNRLIYEFREKLKSSPSFHPLLQQQLLQLTETKKNIDIMNTYRNGRNKKRAWLTLSGLFNMPPLQDDHPDRSIALPLTYNSNGVQDKGHLFPDGIIEHIIELGQSLEFFPFYGHVTKHLQQMNDAYKCHKQQQQQQQQQLQVQLQKEDYTSQTTSQNASSGTINVLRPTAVFPYDWRRPIPELSTELHEFCESTFPNQPVQIVAHSLGGLISFDAMRKHPQKYQPGGVFVGVPFQTGTQYIQDLHHGYYTELNRCRQFTPTDQFTFSSHWIFFPLDEDGVGDLFVDVSDNGGPTVFEPNKSTIGKQVSVDNNDNTSSADLFQPKVNGKNISINFHNVQQWEDLEIGIFNPVYKNQMNEDTIEAYKNHMRIQLDNAKKWREDVLLKDIEDKDKFPNLVLCATDKIPTVNQVLRRSVVDDADHRNNLSISAATGVTNQAQQQGTDIDLTARANNTNKVQKSQCSWEYDYGNGRSVPGDGRIDFDKAFPEIDINMKEIRLDSLHAKQMCWEESGGSYGTIWNEVQEQLQDYEESQMKHRSPQKEKSEAIQLS